MKTRRHAQGLSALAVLASLAGAPAALAQASKVTPVYLQWWENRWYDMEHRVPDFFMAGYGGLWLPPVHKAASAVSVGYDPYDRFDLGRPGAPTAYGTENEFRAIVSELQRANALVNIDIVMNHNSGRTASAAFWASGGYPGFWGGPLPSGSNKNASDNWGDFHNNPNGGCCTYLQSENPGSPNYNLFDGDLVALIDINQGSNNVFIRHPISANPVGGVSPIPAGPSANQPNPANARLYPDLSLPPLTFTNPGTTRNPGAQQVTVHPFNTTNPLAGDPIPENATALLTRWTQWMLDEFKVDGFRIDAMKHTPSWFWDRFWDNAVYLRRTTPWGAKVTPFSFGENVEGNSFVLNNFIRKDGFGNRDALDLNGAGQLRNLINQNGFGQWASALSSPLDTADDGLNNGTLGVNHVFSHDNGSVGNGGSQPPIPTYQQQGLPQNAFVLMRTGIPLIFHNARGVIRPGGFWPREGNPTALGWDPIASAADAKLTRLVQLSNWYGRGDFRPLNASPYADVLVFERFRNNGGSFSANVLVAVNDSYTSGWVAQTVNTSFPQGTILVEQTGAVGNPQVDPTNQLFQTVTVGAGGQVTIRVPYNQNASGAAHHRGYVVYGPAVPAGTLAVLPTASVIPADPPSVQPALRRLTPVPVITAPQFNIDLITTQAQPGDTDTDDNAVFRINQGYRDFNGNGAVDFGPTNDTIPGYESFLTVRQPLFGSGQSTGRYVQTINTSLLDEGYHYISVVAFKRRPAGTDPLFRDFRQVVYVDRQPPSVAFTVPSQPITTTQFEFALNALDRTTSAVHLFANLPPGTDPVPLCTPLNAARRHDRNEWRFTLAGLSSGQNTITAVAFEDSGNVAVQTITVGVSLPCYANCDGSTSAPRLNALDFSCFLTRYRQALELPFEQQAAAYANCDGSLTLPVLNALDFSCFLAQYQVGCP